MKKIAAVPFPNIQEPEGFKFTGEKATIGDIINDLVPYIFALAGLALLFILILGGFELLTSAGDPKKMESAKGKITNAILGFIIIFVAYWLVQILQVVFGIKILG